MAKTRRLPNISLAECPLSMGRSSDNDLVLQHTTVSRRHCLIEIEDGAAVLRDLSSRHGTRVNGRKVEETTNVADGDLIRVGPFEIEFGPAAKTVPTAATSDNELDPASAAIDEVVETLRDELAHARNEVQVQTTRVASLETELGKQRLDLDSHGSTLDRTESELESTRQSLQRAERELAERQKKLAETEEDVAALEAQLEHRDRTAREAVEQVGVIQEVLARFEATVEDIRIASQKASATARNVRALEALWVEANDWVEEAERSGDPMVIQQATGQRDNVGARLEQAHAERDDAIAELQALVSRLDETNVPIRWQPPPPPRPRRASLAKRVIQAIGDRR